MIKGHLVYHDDLEVEVDDLDDQVGKVDGVHQNQDDHAKDGLVDIENDGDILDVVAQSV